MKGLYYAALLVCLSILTFNCQKDISYSGPGNPGAGNNNTAPLTATLQGNIVDETGQPATGVAIRVGTKTAITNTKGYFRIVNAALDKNASMVTAEKSGYFKAYRSFCATSGVNHVRIKLVKKVLAGTIDAASGGTVTLANGSKIMLPANGVVKASGSSAYTGNINVYAAYIDPTAVDISQTVPGSFMADDKNNKRVTLASYGMLAVELESSAGEKLQIAQGSAATLTSPIPSSLQASAPATIALWYVNEQTGIWKEEGTATKNGNNYTGEVKHFSFWNCDIGIPAITLSLTLKNGEGLPIVHGALRLTRPIAGWQTNENTDTLGQASGLVPSGEILLLEVMDPCYNVIYSQNIGPFTGNTDLGVITISAPGSNSMVTIKGKMKNCSNALVTNGYALVNYDNVTRYASVNSAGEFATSFLRCSGGPATAEVLGIDISTQQQGVAISVPITTPVTITPDIIACGASTAQFINYTIDGTDHSITSAANDSLYSYTYSTSVTPPLVTWMSGLRITNGDNISFNFSHNAGAGTYGISNFSTQNFDSLLVVPPFNIVLTSYPATVGGFYEGTFSGQFKQLTLPVPVHNINGSFRIRRLN
jgi:hypothetical protein